MNNMLRPVNNLRNYLHVDAISPRIAQYAKMDRKPRKLRCDVGCMLVVAASVCLIWGVVCFVIGGILRFNSAKFVNEYIRGVNKSMYTDTSQGLITIPSEFSKVYIDSWVDYVGNFSMLLGVLVIMYSVVAIAGGLLKSKLYLFVPIVCFLLTILPQVAILWMVNDSGNHFHQQNKNSLVQKLQAEYTLGKRSNQFSKIIDALMIAGECCGIKGGQDFNNPTMHFTDPQIDKLYMFSVSPACCKKKTWQAAASTVKTLQKISGNKYVGFKAFEMYLVNCSSTNPVYRELRNTRGCYGVLFDQAMDGHWNLVFAFIVFIIVWEGLVIGAALLVLVWTTKEQARADPEPESESEASQALRKGFTPYCKLSSSTRNERLNKIPSVEIW